VTPGPDSPLATSPKTVYHLAMRYTHLGTLCLAVPVVVGLALAGCGKGNKGEGGGVGVTAGSELTILFSAGNNGEIEPCG
jgi:hypothetical protein